MLTFDDIVPIIKETLAAHADALKRLSFLLINRDLYGRVRLIAPETVQEEDVARAALERLAVTVAERLGPHAYHPNRPFSMKPTGSSLARVPQPSRLKAMPTCGWWTAWRPKVTGR